MIQSSMSQFHVVDASPRADARWSPLVRRVGRAELRVWDAVPARLPVEGPNVWVLVPASFASPLAQQEVREFAQRVDLRDSVVIVRDGEDESTVAMESVVYMMANESDESFIRTFELVCRTARDQHALHAALQFPIENPSPVLLFSKQGALVYANPAATQLTVQHDGVVGDLEQRVRQWVVEQQDDTHVIAAGPRTFGFRLERHESDGMIRAYGMDLTQSRDAIRKAIRMEEESRNKDEFLATMSHELRTPLNAILSCTEALREHAYGPLNPEQLDAIGTVRESGKHLLWLINDILDISKIAAGQLELERATLGVRDVVGSVVEMLRSTASAKGIRIETEYRTDSPTLFGDPVRIKQILLNLMGNAIKFSPNGTCVGVLIRDAEEPDTLAFDVWDSGPGVSSDFASAIFKPFIQAEGTYSRSKPGTGLGLSIARDLAMLHGGTVQLEAFDRPGAVFTVTLPVGEPTEGELFDFRATGSWDLHTEGEMGNETTEAPIDRVLIAEDTDSSFRHLHDLLVSMGYTVDRACTGVEAVEVAKRTRPDLVLMDIDMPVMNGLDAIRLLRSGTTTAGLPIIAVTAMAGVANEQSCLSAGADGFLVKPYPLRDLMAMMLTVGRVRAARSHSSH